MYSGDTSSITDNKPPICLTYDRNNTIPSLGIFSSPFCHLYRLVKLRLLLLWAYLNDITEMIAAEGFYKWLNDCIPAMAQVHKLWDTNVNTGFSTYL